MNSSSVLAHALFLLVCLGLMALPFVPVVREWRRPTDAGALPVARDYATDIDYFAASFRAAAIEELGSAGPAHDSRFAFVSGSSLERLELDQGRPLIASGSIDSSTALRSAQPLYVAGSLRAAAASAFTAVYAAGDLELGGRSRITQWAHAEGVARLGAECGVVRRLSAGVAVELGRECWFERIQAPLVRAGWGAGQRPPKQFSPQVCASFMEVAGVVQRAPSCFLVDGDCALPAGRRYAGSLVVRGFLTIGAHTTVAGDIKARDGASLGRQASVEGALTCDRRVYMLPEARAFGPLVSESDVLIGAGAVVGSPAEPTTVSARNIILEEGAVVHGEIWAHELGMVKGI